MMTPDKRERIRKAMAGWVAPSPLIVRTLAEHMWTGCTSLYVVCPECRHATTVELIEWVERYGRDENLGRVLRALRCAECGRKGRPSITLLPGGDNREDWRAGG